MKLFKGKVVKIIDKKTIKIEVERKISHPIYQKQFRQSKNYLVDSQGKEVNLGQEVAFKECRPVSKRKKWQLAEEPDKKEKNK